MQAVLLNLNPEEDLSFCKNSDVHLSFGPFLRFIREKASKEQTLRKDFYQYVLDKFSPYPELEEGVDVTLLHQYKEVLEVMYAMLSPSFEEEKNVLWALGTPLTPVVFYGTDALYRLVDDMQHDKVYPDHCTMYGMEFKDHTVKFIYSLILERLFNFKFLQREDMVYSIRDEHTGLNRYFKVNLDTRFLDVKAKKPLPDLTFENVESSIQEQLDFSIFEKILPLDHFAFEGITVITLNEVTEEYAVESIKNVILNDASEKLANCYGDVIDALQTLVQDKKIEFGIFPLLRINKKLKFYPEICRQSILLSIATGQGQAEGLYHSLAEEYVKKPRLIYFRKITAELAAKYEFLQMLHHHGVSAYALVPVFNNQELVGMVEVYTRKEDVLDEKVMSRLDPAMPLLAQLLVHTIEDLETQVETVIKDKFTFLQPAVQWKFNEVAWKFMRAEMAGNPAPRMENITFEQVYPLYGAIDIRDSTVQRNSALHVDFRRQFGLLEQTFSALRAKVPLALMDEMMFKCRKRMEAVENGEADNDQLWVNEFLETEVHPFLVHIRHSHPETEELVNKYFSAIDDSTGVVYENRRRLEASMRLVNETVSAQLDVLSSDLQHQFPFYFEKFRTDGVEYDVYIGQSLSPDKTFNNIYLKNLRLWQLDSMAAIARKTHALLPEMAVPLRTTQLIFVHSHPIDISFRNDERRFDVEGTYNIRYHIIKKRIDKVCIRNTNERLTQPGKIAIVYFNQKEAAEYISYIHYLQEQGVLLNDLEELELEELQGVSGLHAIRVGVNLAYGSVEKNRKENKITGFA